MITMQQFYQTYIVENTSNPYHLLAETDPGDIFLDDFFTWSPW
jgi:hypothetical protein